MGDKAHETSESEPTLEQVKALFVSTLRRVGRSLNERHEIDAHFREMGAELPPTHEDAISAYIPIAENAVIGPNLQKVINQVSLGSKDSRITKITYHKDFPSPEYPLADGQVYESLEITLEGGEGGLKEDENSVTDFVDPFEEVSIRMGLDTNKFEIYVNKQGYLHRVKARHGDITSLLKAKRSTIALSKDELVEFADLISQSDQNSLPK